MQDTWEMLLEVSVFMRRHRSRKIPGATSAAVTRSVPFESVGPIKNPKYLTSLFPLLAPCVYAGKEGGQVGGELNVFEPSAGSFMSSNPPNN